MNLKKLLRRSEKVGKKADPGLKAGPQPAPPPAPPLEFDRDEMEQKILEALRTIYDPEIPVNIYEIGLVYGIDIDPAGAVVVRMTLTSPGCPVAVSLPIEVETKVRMIPGVASARVDLVWEPQWTPDMMSEAARLQLGFF
jgi:FeS assembly SUF system protein